MSPTLYWVQKFLIALFKNFSKKKFFFLKMIFANPIFFKSKVIMFGFKIDLTVNAKRELCKLIQQAFKLSSNFRLLLDRKNPIFYIN